MPINMWSQKQLRQCLVITLFTMTVSSTSSLAASLAADSTVSEPIESQTRDILMKGAKPEERDAYLCTSYPIDDQEAYIYKFEVTARASTAHHILMYGCVKGPYSTEPIWACGQLCDGESSILFGWAKNAPPAILPKGVGVRIGKQTYIKSIVLQVHYSRSFAENEPADHSGIRIYTTHEKQPFVAGIFLLGHGSFNIPPGNPSYKVDVSCKFDGQKNIFPFAYRTHAHTLGSVITGYQYNGSYHEIGKGNPQWPQAFYPVKNHVEVKPGDVLAMRCTYDSTKSDHSVGVGATGYDEMCNFYIMFYTDSSVENPFGQCWGNKYKELTGDNFPPDASVLLPPNPALEEEAKGHHRHGGMKSSDIPAGEEIHFDQKLVNNASWQVDKLELGEIGGVATDKDGNVYIFHRGSRQWMLQSFSYDNDFMSQDSPIEEDVVVILDSQGRLVRKFGAGQYFMPHGIEVDKAGNIWLTDVALHQVFKILPGQSKPSLVLGQRFKHGTDTSSFCKPTDVAVLSSGEFFVSDGYCNGRVLKFAQNGTVVRVWGKRNAISDNPPEGTFDVPHSITLSEENNLVCVADRENGRIQCFDLDGNIKHVIKHEQFGPRLFAVAHSPDKGGVLYAVNGPSNTDVTVQGFTLDIKTGHLLETWNVPQLLKSPHDLCVHSESRSVYVGEIEPPAVWRLSRGPDVAKLGATPHMTPKHDHAPTETKVNGSTPAPTGNINGKVSPTVGSNDTSVVVNKVKDIASSDLSPSLIIGCLLVVPVILLLVITLVVRARKTGSLKCWGQSKKRVFSLQGILGNSHKGFDPLSTEDSDHDLDQEDSDREEYLAPKKIKGKA